MDISTRKSYMQVRALPSFEERYEYLKLSGATGAETFGWDRYLNQALYQSREWRDFRNKIIIRDNGCDLAHPDRPIICDRITTHHPGRSIAYNRIIIHHLNPLTVDDVENRSPVIFDPDNVICVSHLTHEAIHYGDANLLAKDPVVRRPNDTIPWK